MKKRHYLTALFSLFVGLLVLPCMHTSLYADKGKLSFVQNIGQVTDQFLNRRDDIDFKIAAGNGLNVLIGTNALHYQWAKTDDSVLTMYRMDVELVGANPEAKPTAEGRTSTFERYYTNGLDGAIAHRYVRIIYKDVYPNIDWVFYFNQQGQLEHDFVVRPGGKVEDIKLRYSGASDLAHNADGSLTATTPFGTVMEKAPYAFEQKSGKNIPSAFVLDGNILSFSTGTHSGTLVIDPTLEWATYFGGSEYDQITAVVHGRDGHVYAAGSTNSASNIATTGSHLDTFSGGNNTVGADAFVTKFDPDGNCIWATYYGGTNVDVGTGIASDTAGYIYLAGRTNSSVGIATVGSHQDTKAGTNAGYDAYIAKFDTAGQRIWGTYFGGTGAEGSEAIAIAADRFDNIYLAGNTQSANGIATTGAYQDTRPGGQDGFLAKFSTNGVLDWATYYGTSSNDFINAVTTDTTGNILVVGHTTSTTGLAGTGAYQSSNNGGNDGFVAKFDATGQYLWGTYIGGPLSDRLQSVVADTAGNLYVSGVTVSTTDIATANSHQSTLGGAQDIYLAKFTATGNLDWSTYYGGEGNEGYPSLHFQTGDKLYLTSQTTSDTGITTPDGINPVYNNSASEAFLAQFDLSGNRIWGSYFGGDLSEQGNAITGDGADNVYLAGRTSSISGLATPGAYQTVFGGNQDGFLLRVNMCDLPAVPDTISGETTVCEGSTQVYGTPEISGAAGYVWLLPVGWIGSSNVDSISVVAGEIGGIIQVAAINACGSSDTFTLAVSVEAAPSPIVQRNGNVLQTTQAYATYQWNLNGQPITGATAATHLIAENGAYSVKVTGDNGCEGTSAEAIVDDITGIDDLYSRYGIEVYPNPASSDRVYIKSSVPVTVRLTDITGRLLQQWQAGAGTSATQLQAYGSGLFVISFFDKDNRHLGSIRLSKID